MEYEGFTMKNIHKAQGYMMGRYDNKSLNSKRRQIKFEFTEHESWLLLLLAYSSGYSTKQDLIRFILRSELIKNGMYLIYKKYTAQELRNMIQGKVNTKKSYIS